MSNIFEEMADALTEAGQTVGTKVKEARDITALKAKLHSHEKVLTNAYLKLGKDYYEANKDDVNTEKAAEFEEIKKQINEIEDLKKCIDELKKKS